jgi:hypothetical protein
MEIEKAIFLDIDGPLATDECFKTTEMKFGKRLYKWNVKCCETLNEILNETGAEIVLSSDWRKFFTMEELEEIFKWNNIVKSPVAVTDEIKVSYSSRGDIDRIYQIERFLKNNQIKNWVSVDDLDLKSDIVPNFVHVETEEGLSADGVKEKLILFLNQN